MNTNNNDHVTQDNKSGQDNTIRHVNGITSHSYFDQDNLPYFTEYQIDLNELCNGLSLDEYECSESDDEDNADHEDELKQSILNR